MEKVAALLILVGSGCRVADPNKLIPNCIWVGSIVTATFSVLATKYQTDILFLLTKLGAVVMLLFIALGFVGLIREVRKWPE